MNPKLRARFRAACLCLLAGCSPALDWREVRPEDSGLVVLMPCKPDSQARQVTLASVRVRMVLYACTAGGVTWAVAYADVGDPSKVGPALDELRTSAAKNLQASDATDQPLRVEGATPNASSRRAQFSGRMPDGRAATEQTAVFAKGTRVFQAVALGQKLDPEALSSFFDSLRVLA
jgi:hypothetical protein